MTDKRNPLARIALVLQEGEGTSVGQRTDFQEHGSSYRPVDPSAALQRLITAIGAGTREALWAVQLIERKAAVARWRSGLSGEGTRKAQLGTKRPR